MPRNADRLARWCATPGPARRRCSTTSAQRSTTTSTRPAALAAIDAAAAAGHGVGDAAALLGVDHLTAGDTQSSSAIRPPGTLRVRQASYHGAS